MISYFDIKFGNTYFINDKDWRNSLTCNALGIMGSFSCLQSHFSLFIMTIEKYNVISDKQLLIKKLSLAKSLMIQFLSIFISISLSIIPNLTFKV